MRSKRARAIAYKRKKKGLKKRIACFIQKATAKHNGKYSYDNMVFVRPSAEVTIRCPEHGDFKQTPSNHLNNRGCPVCRSSKNEQRLAAIFKKYDVPFVQEFKLKQYNNRYRYDFYLPLQRVIVEFHGDHHYRDRKHYGGESKLKFFQQRDREKEAIANEAGIPIVVLNRKTAMLDDDAYEELVLNYIRKAYETRQNVYPDNHHHTLSNDA